MTKAPKPNPFDSLKNVARPGAAANIRTAPATTPSSAPVRPVNPATPLAEDNRVEQLAGGMSSRKLAGGLIIPLDLISPHPNQIRSEYDKEALQELAADIALRGVLEPILVREINPGQYQIIAGERRFRAARLAGLKDIPAIVKNMDDRETSMAMLVENIQRQELSPLDEKRFFEQLQAEYNLSAKEIAKLINKSAMYVTRRLNGELTSLQTSTNSIGEVANNSEISHNDNVELSSLQNSQLERGKITEKGKGNKKEEEGAAKSKKSLVFKFSLSPIEKLKGNLATAREVFAQAEARPTGDKAAQIKKSLKELKEEIAALEATLDEE